MITVDKILWLALFVSDANIGIIVNSIKFVKNSINNEILKCPVSSERRVLDLESEVDQMPGLNPH